MFITHAPFLSEVLPLQQSPGYGRTLRALGSGVELVSEPGLAHMLVVSRPTRFGTLRLVTRGPVWDTTETAAQVDFLRRHGPTIINADATDNRVMRRSGYIRIMTPAHLALLSLTQPLAGQCRTKWRNAWRKGEKAGLKLRYDAFDPARDGWILNLEKGQQRALRYRGYPDDFTMEFARLNPTELITYTAALDHEPVAAMIFAKHSPTATYHIGWSGMAGRAACAHHVILMRAAADFAAQGVTMLDLGLIDTVRAPGLARFKLGTGARVHRTGGTWLRLPGRRGAGSTAGP